MRPRRTGLAAHGKVTMWELLKCRAGTHPVQMTYCHGAFKDRTLSKLMRWRGQSDRHVAHLTTAFSNHAASEPAKLTTIAADERDTTGARGWPNTEKLSAMYAEVLPEVIALYKVHQPPAKGWPTPEAKNTSDLSSNRVGLVVHKDGLGMEHQQGWQGPGVH